MLNIRSFSAVLLLATSASAFAGGGTPPPPPPPSDNTPVGERSDIRVMTYNVQQLPNVASTFVGDWDDAARLARIPSAIRNLSEQPDVIVFTEAFTDAAYDGLGSLSDLYPYRTPVVGQVCSGGGWQSTSGNCSGSIAVVRGGAFIMSKWPIEVQHQYIYHNSHSSTSDWNSNKGIAYARVDRNGHNYHIFGTHMQADEAADHPISETHAVRMNQLTEMKNWINGFGISSSQPVIIAGDFNVEYSRTDHVNTMLANSQSVLSYTPDSVGSFSAADNLMAKVNAYYYEYSQQYNDTLDYIITRQDHLQPKTPAQMSVVRLKNPTSWYWSYMTNVVASGLYNDLADHYPVVATFDY